MKQFISEEFLKMQKLAGIITEGEYRKSVQGLLREFLSGNYAINPTGIVERSNHVIELLLVVGDKKHVLKVKGPGKAESSYYSAKVEETDLPDFEKDDELALTFGLFSKEGDGTVTNYSLMKRDKNKKYEIAAKTESIMIGGKKVLPMPDDANNTGSKFYQAYSAAKEKTTDPLAMFDDYSVLEK